MTELHVTGWASDAPTPAQLKEFFAQVDSGRITKQRVQDFLRNKAERPPVPPQATNPVQKPRPDARDFILATIRTIRRTPDNMLNNVKAGVTVDRIWQFAEDMYSEEEFRDTLNELLREKILVGTWDISHVVSTPYQSGEHTSFFTGGRRIFSEIPLGMPFQGGYAKYRDMKGNFYQDRETMEASKLAHEYDQFRVVMVYIIADGMTGQVEKMYRRAAHTKAEQIIEQLQKS
jgi:hypothetical protein